MIVVLVVGHARDGLGDEVAEAVNRVAEAVSHDPDSGCLRYEVSRSQEDPDLFYWYEYFRDQEALVAHRNTEYFDRLVVRGVRPLLQAREGPFICDRVVTAGPSTRA